MKLNLSKLTKAQQLRLTAKGKERLDGYILNYIEIYLSELKKHIDIVGRKTATDSDVDYIMLSNKINDQTRIITKTPQEVQASSLPQPAPLEVPTPNEVTELEKAEPAQPKQEASTIASSSLKSLSAGTIPYLEVKVVKEFETKEVNGKTTKNLIVRDDSLAKEDSGAILDLWEDDVDKFKTGDTIILKKCYCKIKDTKRWKAQKFLSKGKLGSISANVATSGEAGRVKK